MSNPLSAFHDDDGQWSMTRTVAWIFALTYCYVLVLNAANSHLMNWPFCALGVVTLLAVPLQAFFRYLQVWFTSSPGQRLLSTLMTKVTGMANTATSTTVTSSTETKA